MRCERDRRRSCTQRPPGLQEDDLAPRGELGRRTSLEGACDSLPPYRPPNQAHGRQRRSAQAGSKVNGTLAEVAHAEELDGAFDRHYLFQVHGHVARIVLDLDDGEVEVHLAKTGSESEIS